MNTENVNNTNKDSNNGMGNKKITMIVAALLVIAVVVWGITAISGRNDNMDSNNGENVQDSQQENVNPDAKPVFKFFYSSSAENAAEITAVVEELKAQYGEQVDFDVSDIDEHPEYVEQFSVIMPPQLYMLKKNGDFSDMKFGTYDKTELEDAIKKALE